MTDRTGLFVAPLPGTTPLGTSPTDGRLVLGSLFGTGAGRLQGSGFSTSATQMQVGIFASVWRIPDPTNSSAVYLSPADTQIIGFSAGPASGSRKDVIWVRQNNFEAGDANSRVTYGVTAGTASATPVEPAVPSGAMKIGVLTVPAGVTNTAACTLTETYPGTVLPPSIGANTSALLGLVTGTYRGQRAFVSDFEYRWNGIGWDLLPGPTTFCHLAWQSSNDQSAAADTWTAVAYDTVIAGNNSFVSNGAAGQLQFPWTGRYSIDARWTPRNTTTNRISDEIYAQTAELGSVSIPSGIALSPHSYHFEVVASSGIGFQHRVRFDYSANAIANGTTQLLRPELIIRYLGSA